MIKQYEIPDVRDGLTSLQRRILWVMRFMGNTSKKPYRKAISAICEAGKGENLDGHHSRSSFLVTDYALFGSLATYTIAMMPMGQDFRYHLPLIESNGNWGDLEDGGTAAPIFIECRLTEFSEKVLLAGLNQQSVPYVLASKSKRREPSVLPARIPNVLVTGTSGVSHIPPHNLGEVIDACIAMLKKPDLKPEQLFDYIQGPDFPTGATIINKSELLEIYQTGAGEIRIRGMVETEPTSEGEKQIIVREIPYPMAGKTREFLEDLKYLKSHRILPDITSVTDSTRYCREEKINIRVTLKKNADAEHDLELLYEYTDLEGIFDYRALLMSNGKPFLMSLHQILSEWLDFYRETKTKQNRGAVPSKEEMITELLGFKAKFATPRKTKIIDAL